MILEECYKEDMLGQLSDLFASVIPIPNAKGIPWKELLSEDTICRLHLFYQKCIVDYGVEDERFALLDALSDVTRLNFTDWPEEQKENPADKKNEEHPLLHQIYHVHEGTFRTERAEALKKMLSDVISVCGYVLFMTNDGLKRYTENDLLLDSQIQMARFLMRSIYENFQARLLLEDADQQLESYCESNDLPVPKDPDLKAIVKIYDENKNCNVAENDTWEYAVREYLKSDRTP